MLREQYGSYASGLSDESGAAGRRAAPRRIYPVAKRGLDIAVTLLLAPFALLVVGILALLIRMDGGKAFYCQQRVGKDGRLFNFWKLRTMVPDAKQRLQEHLSLNPAARAEWDLTQKLANDPRVTKLGRLLRKFSVDELPQLFNVLRGDMSLVGPRPMMPEQRQHYHETAYFGMRPGITGLWQVSERNACTFAERARHDTRYATSMSFATDVRILLMTFAVVFRGTGI